MKRTIMIALLAVFVAFPVIMGAQTLTGTITGKVTDEQGGVLPGVTVTLTGKTGSQMQVTDARGEYRFLGLSPGNYSVKADLTGFRAKEQTNLEVGIGKTIELPLTLAMGALSESVDVIANAVTIDTTTTATDTNMSQDLLFSMPISHDNPATGLLQYMPGVTDGSAFGGASDAGNALMLDGVDTRDPEGGTAWAFYNYNIIEEVQVGSLGQPAEYGGFTGAVVNTITKSGGNRYSFLSEYRYTGDKPYLFQNNADPAITALNPGLGSPRHTLSMKDYTVQLGGPIVKDKVFFFTSFQRYSNQEKATGNYVSGEVSPRFNFKVTYQPTPRDQIIGSLQYDNYNIKGRTGFISGYRITNQDQTIQQDSPEYIYNAQYRRVFNSSTFLEAKYIGWSGYYDLNPVSPAPYAIDYDAGGKEWGGAGYTYMADRTRNQVNIALSKYAQFAGTHNFKFGAEIERSTIRDRNFYSQVAPGIDGYWYKYGGYWYASTGGDYDFQGKNKRESYYAQDQWKVGRITANVGLRLDNNRGEATATGQEMYKTFSVGPRLGMAWDVFGKGTSVMRAYYGRLYDGGVFQSWSRTVPGLTDGVLYVVPDATFELPANNRITDTSLLLEIDRSQALMKYQMDPNIKHPRTDEFNVAWEQQLGKQLKLTATGIYRKWANFQNAVALDTVWSPYLLTLPAWADANGLPYPGSSPVNNIVPLVIYRSSVRSPRYVITNTDNIVYNLSGFAQDQITVPGSRTYKGLMLVLQKAFRDRWQAQVSYVLSKTDGTVSNSSGAGNSGGQFSNANNILVNRTGPTAYDRRHVIKVFGGYTIPKAEVAVNAYWTYQSGWPFAAYYSVKGSNVNWSGTLNVNIDTRDNHLTPAESQLDLRLEKQLRFGVHRFGVYLDASNVLNQSGVTGLQSRFPYTSATTSDGLTDYYVKFGDPTSMQASRQIILGARWSF